MRPILLLMIAILPLCAPATFASEIEFQEGLNSLAEVWGKGRLPSEIKGKVKVADISGSEKVLTSGSIRLTSSPIFVERIE